jgi:hypothetical protein
MRNPLRSEAEAYRFLWLTIAAFASIGLASVLGGWKAGLPVFIVVTAAAIWFYFRQAGEGRPAADVPTVQHPPDEERILVIANETVGGAKLREAIRERSTGRRAEVLVVSPALNSPLRHWVSDEDQARAIAQHRLDESLARLGEAGIRARGEVGDSDPLQAIEDALRTFGADEIVISTHPEGRSHWLEQGLVGRARERFGIRTTHVVVDLEREREEVLESDA